MQERNVFAIEDYELPNLVDQVVTLEESGKDKRSAIVDTLIARADSYLNDYAPIPLDIQFTNEEKIALMTYAFLLEDFRQELENAEFIEYLPNPAKEQTLEDDVLEYLKINKGIPLHELDTSGITLLKQLIVSMSAQDIEKNQRPEEVLERLSKRQDSSPVIQGFLKAIKDYAKLAFESGLIE